MKAQILEELCIVDDGVHRSGASNLPLKSEPLTLREVETPHPKSTEILIKVLYCGVCHTELDEIEGRRVPKLPVVLGHEVVGMVYKRGERAKRFSLGDIVGVAWIFRACGVCELCKSGMENLCKEFMGTGCDADGGYAEYMVVDEKFAYSIPSSFELYKAAPLMCAGAVGYRAMKLAKLQDGLNLGLFGFGASAHIIIQVVRFLYPNIKVFVFTRSKHHQDLALEKGAYWVGKPADIPPEKIHRAIDFTPVGETIAKAMAVMESGGRLVINAIRKRTPVVLDYEKHIWYEKEIKSVANVTRRDVEEFLPIAAKIPIKPEVELYPLGDANKALRLLKQGKIKGAAVLSVQE